ncbi:hypothetical protein [Streptomyces sp. CAU 1734]|uniref:hypothetical protein n=1 Tax=Streptomyces sp. CAU 1734 TaxID=3140360 RepID=UPI003261554D
MTACAIEAATELGSISGGGFTIAADGSYAARLAGEGEALFPERWTLAGPEPYAVPLPLGQPEERDTDLVPLADGRVLIRRGVAGRHLFSLLYPAGPGTAELPLGGVECRELRLLPPSPDGNRAYAIAPGPRSTSVWLVAGGAFGPEHVAEVPGVCSGGAWLDRTGRLLALDRGWSGGGPVKTVVVDLERGGEVSELLQITEDSNDRLLMADPDSGLLLISSDAPGHQRLGWGVLGSLRPVRFPESLRMAECAVTPFAVQPGQVLMPESCGVALRIDGPDGSRPAVWRPSGGRIHQLGAPDGWLTGTGLWSPEGVLRLPCVTGAERCGVARVETADIFAREERELRTKRESRAAVRETRVRRAPVARAGGPGPLGGGPVGREGFGTRELMGFPVDGGTGSMTVYKPIPLQQAPLMGRMGPG